MSISEKTLQRYMQDAIDKRARIEAEDAQIKDWNFGSVKWFDQKRRFGFVFFDDPNAQDDEAFFSWTILQESNIRESAMRPGVKVRFTIRPSKIPGNRPEVVRISLMDRVDRRR